MMGKEEFEPTIHRGKCVICGNPGTIDSYGYCEICRESIDPHSRNFAHHYGQAINYRKNK